MKLRDYILNNKPPLNTSIYLNCPVCGGVKKLGVTNKAGKLLYQCLRDKCRTTRGAIQYDRSLAELRSLLLPPQPKEFTLPERIIRGWNPRLLDYLTKVNSMEAYRLGYYEVGYDPAEDRAVFIIKHDNRITGAVGRALNSRVTPKAITYLGSEPAPFVCGNGSTAVLVEDCASACSIARLDGYVGVALLGTSFKSEYNDYIKQYDTIVVALDDDAWKSNIRLFKWLKCLYSQKNIIKWHLTKDLKDMSLSEIKEYVDA